jgi:hypothetical protein
MIIYRVVVCFDMQVWMMKEKTKSDFSLTNLFLNHYVLRWLTTLIVCNF